MVREMFCMAVSLGACLWALDSRADFSADVGVSTSVGVAGDYNAPEGHRSLSVGLMYDQFYLRGGIESMQDRLLGQPMGRIKAATAEAGIRLPLKSLSLELGGGYWFPLGQTQNGAIIDEMAYTHLVNRHANEGRPIPLLAVRPNAEGFEQKYVGCRVSTHPNCYDSTYEYEPSPYLRASLQYVLGSVELGFDYRFLSAKNYMAIGINDGRIHMLDDLANAPGGWWMEHGGRNLSTVGFSVRWRF